MSTAEPTYEALKAENAALRRRTGELEQRVAELERALGERERMDALGEDERRVPYQKVFDAIPLALGAYRRDGLCVAMNRQAIELVGGVHEEIVGNFNILTDPASISAGFVDNFNKAAESRQNVTMPPTSYDTGQSDLARIDDRTVWTETTYVPVQGDDGAEYVVECNIDVTAQQRAQRALEEHVRALSTPLIPIAERVLVMPLIGNVSGARAQQVLEALLEGVAAHRAAVAILDVTGVPRVDAAVADALIQAAKAVALLGAQVVITGMRPEMARALVELGTDLRGLVTLGTLQSGVKYALRR